MWEIFDRAGGLGVGLFFAISGYLMAQLAQNTPPMRFLVHRIVRIYPIYWICVLTVVFLGIPFGAYTWPNTGSLLLVPGLTQAYTLGVEWTLPFELAFYLIIFLIMVAGLVRYIPIIAVIWVLLIQLFLVIRPDLQQGQFPGLLHLPLSAFSLPFTMGLLVPFLVSHKMVGSATPLIAFGFLVSAESMVTISRGMFYGFSAVGCTLLVAWAVRPTRQSKEPNPSLLALGDWSYALYLCHVPVIIALCKLMPASVASMQLWFAAVGAPIVVAVFVGKLDISLYRGLKRRLDGSSKRVTNLICGIFLITIFSFSSVTYYHSFKNVWIARGIDPIGRQLESSLAAGGAQMNLRLAAESSGLHYDSKLEGHFDGVYRLPEEVRVHGWAADSASRRINVLIFHCGNYLGVAPRDSARPDVAKSLGIGDANSGFTHNLRMRGGSCSSNQVDALILGPTSEFAIFSSRFN
ncbi:acyltransferase 3 [Pseudoxanthomonas spadix BD-a59]|uniref:Acyltransferase 3 n=2 Tax=Pseudoxanthomonas spadix TaxID=415229 RepID=G7UVM4_PSEUP|nr:acyltransferase 3 [Pseudoxanthomonas spadix BD-a59]